MGRVSLSLDLVLRTGTALDSAASSAEALAEQLAQEMAAAWRAGDPVTAERLLARHPGLGEHEQAVRRLVYEEVCLREELGQELPLTEFVRRFPRWRRELAEFLGLCRVVHPARPRFPEPGGTLGDVRLLAELGRGGMGRVYLATQPNLGDRPVVLKVTPRVGQEHLALARLQHTHIVPLYWVQDFPDRNLRALCMPYLGGVTLAQLLDGLRPCPPGRRSGRDLLDALERAGAEAPAPAAANAKGPALAFLARATYAEAVAWLGTCLADALQYAHERGLTHLDLKPSNVLIAADGQPMVLDFHLAREPLRAGEPAPEWFGGTPGYMSPEQREALAAAATGKPVPAPVDGRSDLYALGLVLYEALAGVVPAPPAGEADADRLPPPRLDRVNRKVSAGLADIIDKCLARAPGDRYQDAGALAADLRRHRAAQPLRGVANRSWRERWRKWRCRRPHGLTVIGLLAAVVGTALLAWALRAADVRQRLREAGAALEDGERQMKERQYGEAVKSFNRCLTLVEAAAGREDLRRQALARVALAGRAQAAERLHGLVERLRFAYGAGPLAGREAESLEALSRQEWLKWRETFRGKGAELEPRLEQRLRDDLLDLAILGADLRTHVAAGGAESACREALMLLDEAESLFGASVVLHRERQAHAEALGLRDVAAQAERAAARLAPKTAWEHYALARAELRSGNLVSAAARFERALETEPQEFWLHFSWGGCCYRLGRYGDALSAFHACVTLAPRRAECYHNRALAYDRLGQKERALRDYGRALELQPGVAPALLNRGILHHEATRHAEAAADLHEALACGAEPVRAHYYLTLVALARADFKAARTHLHQVLSRDPEGEEALELLSRFPARDAPGR